MGMLGGPEILIILFIAVVIFGTARLPKIGRSLGEGIRELRKAGRELTKGAEDIKEEVNDVSKVINN